MLGEGSAPSAGRADCLPRGKPFVFSARRHAPGFSRQPGPKGTGGNEGKRVPGGHNRRRRLATRSSCKQQAERTAVRAAPIVCPEESPQCARRRKPLPRRGMTRRLRRGKRACSPMGRSIASVGDPKGVQGERREARAQWAQPPKAVSDPEFRQTTSGAHGSAGRVDCLPRGKPPACSNNKQL